jgi:hypothetical protein
MKKVVYSTVFVCGDAKKLMGKKMEGVVPGTLS